MTSFRPCPICGAELTAQNIRIIDAMGEGASIRGSSDLDDAVRDCIILDTGTVLDPESVEAVTLICSCGYWLWAPAGEIGFPEAGWLKRFEERANRRSGA